MADERLALPPDQKSKNIHRKCRKCGSTTTTTRWDSTCPMCGSYFGRPVIGLDRFEAPPVTGLTQGERKAKRPLR